MTELKQYADMIRDARKSLDYWVELSIIEFTQTLKRLMGTTSQAELAKRMGSTEAYVSRVLGGNDNLTIRQMNKIAHALDAAVHIHVAKRDKLVSWHEYTAAGMTPDPSLVTSGRSESRGESYLFDGLGDPPVGGPHFFRVAASG